MNAVVAQHVSKNYRIYANPADRFKELIFPARSRHRDFWAIKDVSIAVRSGSTFGVIGENGSGKSTLLQMIAGTLQPSEGVVTLKGRVAALLELGAGFNPEFTGRENAFLNASILGLTEAETIRKMPEIERFAEIGNFIDQPVKTYSSGMYVRLAFAVSIHVDPEILLVDESLSVGDVYFQQRCMRRIRQMRQEGKTILFVSHDMSAVKNLCDSAVWLEHGQVKAIGKPDSVVAKYLAAMTQRRDPLSREEVTSASFASATDTAENLVVRTLPIVDHRWGNRQAEVIGIQILDQAGTPCETAQHGDKITIRVSVAFHVDVPDPIVGILMRNRLGEDICGINTSAENVTLPASKAGQLYTLDFHVTLPLLNPGNYSLSAAVARGTHDQYVVCDWIENAINLALTRKTTVYGYLKFDSQIELKFIG